MARWPRIGVGLGLVLLLGLMGGVLGWSWQQTAPASSGLTVAATIFPLADIVKQMGGEYVNVILVIPPGVTEHASMLTPQQLQRLHGAQAIFQIGHGLDDHLVERIMRTIPEGRSIVVDRGIGLREFGKEAQPEGEPDHDEGTDPHYWLTVPQAMKIAETVVQELVLLDSEHASQYQVNYVAYQQELQKLEQELQVMARGAAHKEFMAMHNAWSYFADQYGFRLVGTYEPIEGKEPSFQDLQGLRQLVQQYRLQTFYAEPQKSTAAVSAFMRREFGLKVLTLDPVGGQAGTGSYIELMRANLAALAAG